MVIVGTPTNCVTRSRSISSRARSGVHLYIITSLKPFVKHESMTGTSPVTWKSGSARMKLVSKGFGSLGGCVMAPTSARQANARSEESTAEWAETAPFGKPVVPDV